MGRRPVGASAAGPCGRAFGPGAYTGRVQRPLATASAPRSVARMDPDATYESILSHAIMVEELMHWLVANRHGLHAFAGDGYVLLDSLRVRPEDLRRDNAAALLAGLESLSRETYAGLLAALHRRLRSPELRGLKKIILAWAAWQARRRLGLELEVEDMMEADRLEDYGDVEAYYTARIQAWKEEHRAEGREAGREEGRAEGRVVGQRESIRRQAAMKFDTETAARLGAVLEGVTDQAAFDDMLAALLECGTPSELLARAAEARRGTNERTSPADC